MGMMYKIVTNALEEAGLSDQYHPQDYLNFYCLGKREASSSKPSSQAHQPTENRTLVCFFSLSNGFLTSNNRVMFTCSINFLPGHFQLFLNLNSMMENNEANKFIPTI